MEEALSWGGARIKAERHCAVAERSAVTTGDAFALKNAAGQEAITT
jgi:hypothetical protein